MIREPLIYASVLVLALICKWLHTTPEVGQLLTHLLVPPPPPPKPAKNMGIAKSEREINRQQARSAARLAALVDDGAADAPALQPDEVRIADENNENVITTDLVLRCGEKIPTESTWMTRDVEARVKSFYRGTQHGQHAWRYEVRFQNTGADTVQMLARHWVFVDATGSAHEMKGPGARGVTPVLAPGESWEYESGASLTTPTGSMHGGFQFEVLLRAGGGAAPAAAEAADAPPSAFNVRIARLALSSRDLGENTPCADEPPEGLLAATSVRSTRRVIVGASAQHAESLGVGGHRFWYDVQIVRAASRPMLRVY